MPNPLPLITASYSTGAKIDSPQGKEREIRGGSAFEDVLNENAEQPEVEDLLVPTADPAASPEPSEAEVFTSAETSEEEFPDGQGAVHAPAALQQPPTARDTPVNLTERETNATAIPPEPKAQVLPLVAGNAAQVHHATALGPAAFAPVENIHQVPDPVQKPDDSHNKAAAQPLAPALPNMTGDAAPRQMHLKSDPEAHFSARPAAPAGERTTQPTHILATAKAPSPVQTTGLTTDEGMADIASTSEPEDMFTIKDAIAGQTLRDTSTMAPITTARAEPARAIAGQLAAVISARPGTGGVEIALNPEELGRISITLNGREDGLHLTIAAERPETLDLMRRHIAILSAEFEKLGYGELSLDLGMSGGTGQRDETPEPDPTPDPVEMTSAADQAAPTITIGPDRGLDMRL
ncbi:hook-length control protein FliK [Ruegeria halocynthiae]|uniref:Hook-length control protein FliK n=1 Tax=Ruegeria halocynthiae TaxID=985054 RepID=A0A1H3BZ78_9RHOB|nr:flagellar hook-length control protein FliK [Ruegeria halocynthiae]SDX46519.1 hook-length control protein FliK [Ruegeria halocynthiae]